jgi:tetratricopeptide (TPR) repeat protein
MPRSRLMALVGLLFVLGAPSALQVSVAQPLLDSPDAQALIDQALVLWDKSKRIEGLQDSDLQAEALLERVVAEYPETEQAADALRHLAFGHGWKGLAQDRERYYSKLFDAYPTSKAREQAWMDRNAFIAAEGDVTGAIRCCERILENFPNGKLAPLAILDMGNNYRTLGDCRKAAECYSRLIATYPASADASKARRGLAQCYERMGNWEKALSAYEELTHDTALSSAERLSACLALASAQRKAGLLAQALQTLESLEAKPEWAADAAQMAPAVIFAKLETFLASGRNAEAESEMQTLLVDHPQRYETFLGVMATAAAREAADRYEDAAERYAKAARQDVFQPEWRADAYLQLGKLQFNALQDRPEALASFKRAVELAPHSSAAQLALSYLNTLEAQIGSILTQPMVMSPASMKQVSGGTVYNYRICDGPVTSCPQPCANDFVNGTSWETYGKTLIACRDQTLWERLVAPANCYDTPNVKCGESWFWPSDNYCPKPASQYANFLGYVYGTGCGFE